MRGAVGGAEDANLNGGAAACAAASRIEAIDDELQGLQERIADLLMERGELQESIRSEEADQQEADDSCSEGEGEYMGNAVAVSNLQSNVTEEMLTATFKQLGVLETAWVEQERDLQGMLSGVVVYESAEVALEAQQRFDGVELCGGEMSVRVGVWFDRDAGCSDAGCSGAEEDNDSDLGEEEISEEEI